MVFEHESFTDLILALNHLTEELKARGDLTSLPPADVRHLTTDIKRGYIPADPRMGQIHGISQDPLPVPFQSGDEEKSL